MTQANPRTARQIAAACVAETLRDAHRQLGAARREGRRGAARAQELRVASLKEELAELS